MRYVHHFRASDVFTGDVHLHTGMLLRERQAPNGIPSRWRVAYHDTHMAMLVPAYHVVRP